PCDHTSLESTDDRRPCRTDDCAGAVGRPVRLFLAFRVGVLWLSRRMEPRDADAQQPSQSPRTPVFEDRHLADALLVGGCLPMRALEVEGWIRLRDSPGRAFDCDSSTMAPDDAVEVVGVERNGGGRGAADSSWNTGAAGSTLDRRHRTRCADQGDYADPGQDQRQAET